jgi:hypothetical protein
LCNIMSHWIVPANIQTNKAIYLQSRKELCQLISNKPMWCIDILYFSHTVQYSLFWYLGIPGGGGRGALLNERIGKNWSPDCPPSASNACPTTPPADHQLQAMAGKGTTLIIYSLPFLFKRASLQGPDMTRSGISQAL